MSRLGKRSFDQSKMVSRKRARRPLTVNPLKRTVDNFAFSDIMTDIFKKIKSDTENLKKKYEDNDDLPF